MLNEVLTMHLHRRVWQQARAITDANPTLPPSYWWDFMSDVYGYSQASAVSRLVILKRTASACAACSPR